MGDESNNPGVGISPLQPFRFSPPKPLKGKDDEFELFSYKLNSFLNIANPGFRAAMNTAAQETQEIDFGLLPDAQ
jgi:hypothetical protein